MLKRLLGALFLVSFGLFGAQLTHLNTRIQVNADSLSALIALNHTFNALGYKMDINTIETHDFTSQMDAVLTGIKPLNPKILADNFQDSGIKLAYARMNHGIMELGIDAQNAHWNVPLLGTDEGAQMQRSALPYWFRVEADQIISIEPPYGGKWYPDVSVLDNAMRVLYSYRSDKSADELKFLLPEGAFYLKISNTNGMKVLKEGMWVESMSEGR